MTTPAEEPMALAERRRALYEALLAKRGLASRTTSIITPRSGKGPAPLSYAQSRLWVLDQLDPGTPLYNISVRTRISGNLQVSHFASAVETICRRHTVLRSHVTMVHHSPCQVEDHTPAPALDVEDLSALDTAQQQQRADDIARGEVSSGFNLATGPLLRVRLLRLNAGEHVLLVTMHHIVTDAPSFAIFYRELSELYARACRGEPVVLPELPIQYADFAAWQTSPAISERQTEHLAYWRRKLGGSLPTFALPTDNPRPAIRSYRGAFVRGALPDRTRVLLDSMCVDARATRFMVLFAGFYCLLRRYTGTTDIIIGTTVANRAFEETQSLIGFFQNTLPIRPNPGGITTFRQAVQAMKEATLEAFEHGEIPFQRLVDALRPDRELGSNPFFQVMFVYHDQSHTSAWQNMLQLEGAESTSEVLHTGTAKFDLTMNAVEGNTGLEFELEYNTDVLEARAARSMLSHLTLLLESALDAPDEDIASLPLLTQNETRYLVHAYNDTTSPLPEEQMVHELFEAQVRRIPNRSAIEFGDVTLSYRDLDARATTLATLLESYGVRPGDLVGICLDRHPGMIVAMFGILKAGAGYVPMDPNYPTTRLTCMLESANIRCIVTERKMGDLLQILDTSSVFIREDGHVEESPEKRTGPSSRQHGSPTDSAYVIFTSGSTGKPKGVQIAHRSAVNLLTGFAKKIGFNDGDVFLAAATLSFDLHVLEILVPLTIGAKLVLADRQCAADGHALLDLIRRSKVSVLQGTPVTWRLLLKAGWSHEDRTTALVGGEALAPDLLRAMLERVEFVWNMYGPTETTVLSTCARLTDPDEPVHIGRPIANTQVFVVDENCQLVPPGMTGELLIGGAGVARGYVDRDDLTNERFIENPFLPERSPRLYRTGDLVTLREDGNLRYVGRLDDQVKIRGFRIELGEIEACLRALDDVTDAVVRNRTGPDGEDTLVAYLIPPLDATRIRELRSKLREHLPYYMVPPAFVFLESLPVGVSGKIDYQALPEPDNDAFALKQDDHVEPRTNLEKTVADVWRKVLGIEHIDVRDNFFDIGGNSLSATEVVARLRDELPGNLPAGALFLQPTVESLAELLEAQTTTHSRTTTATSAHPCIVPLRDGEGPPLFCALGAGGAAYSYGTLAEHLDPSQRVLGLQYSQLPDADRLDSIESVAGQYLEAVREVQPHGPYYLAGWSFGGLVAFELARRLREMDETVALLAIIDCAAHLEGGGGRGTLAARVSGKARRTTRILRKLFEARQLVCTYALDLVILAWRSIGGRRAGQPTLREYIHFARSDIARIHALKMAGVAQPEAQASRLHLVQDQFVRTVVAGLRANWRATTQYQMQPYDGTVTLFRSRKSTSADGDTDPTWGYSRIAAGVDVRYIEGEHLMVIRDPHVVGLARQLQASLNSAKEMAHNADISSK